MTTVRKVMSSISKTQTTGVRIKNSIEAGDEHPGRDIVVKHIIRTLQHLTRRNFSYSRRADHATYCSHNKGSGYPFIGHIANDQAELSIFKIKKIIEIATHFTSCHIVCRKMPAG